MTTHPPGRGTSSADTRGPLCRDGDLIRCCGEQHQLDLLPEGVQVGCSECGDPVEGWRFMDAATGIVGHPGCAGFYDTTHSLPSPFGLAPWR